MSKELKFNLNILLRSAWLNLTPLHYPATQSLLPSPLKPHPDKVDTTPL